MNRGEIYYIENHNQLGGALIAGNRPAIIVSNDKNNEYSPFVEVVCLTGTYKFDLPTHVTINSTGKPSTALCEQVQSIDKRDIGSFVGRCTAEEMNLIDIALQISLGIETQGGGGKTNNENEAKSDELIKAMVERDTFERLYKELLGRMLA